MLFAILVFLFYTQNTGTLPYVNIIDNYPEGIIRPFKRSIWLSLGINIFPNIFVRLHFLARNVVRPPLATAKPVQFPVGCRSGRLENVRLLSGDYAAQQGTHPPESDPLRQPTVR